MSCSFPPALCLLLPARPEKNMRDLQRQRRSWDSDLKPYAAALLLRGQSGAGLYNLSVVRERSRAGNRSLGVRQASLGKGRNACTPRMCQGMAWSHPPLPPVPTSVPFQLPGCLSLAAIWNLTPLL